MVFTKITIEGLTHLMWLPAMNNNKTMKDKPYTYDTKYRKGIVVEAETMFDINRAIMRCLVKNLVMFGLYIYAGEDLPNEEVNEGINVNKETINLLIEEVRKYEGEESKKIKSGILKKYGVSDLKDLREDQAKETILRLQNFKKRQKMMFNLYNTVDDFAP